MLNRKARLESATLLALLLVGVSDLASIALAQPAAPTQGYVLRHVAAQDAQQIVLQLMDHSALRGEVSVDVPQNALVVHGDDSVQQLVRQTLQALDQPTAASVVPPTLQTYPAPADQLEQMGEAVRAQFGPHGARVASDGRNAQLLIVAPADVQAEIGRFLGVKSMAASGAASAPAGLAASGPATATRPIRLGGQPNLDMPAPQSPQGANFGLLTASVGGGQILQLRIPSDQMQRRLQELWGTRLQLASSSNRDVAMYTLEMGPQVRLRIEFDQLSNQVAIHGPRESSERCARLLALLEGSSQGQSPVRTQVMPLGASSPAKVIQVATMLQQAKQHSDAMRRAAQEEVRSSRFVAHLFQPGAGNNQPPAPSQPGNAAQPTFPGPQLPPAVNGQGGAGTTAGSAAAPALPNTGEAIVPLPQRPDTSALVGPVQVEVLEDLGVIVLRGSKDDVDRLVKIIQQIEETSLETEPLIEVYPLQYVNGESLATIVTQLYDSVYATRKGRVSITPLIDPNALLLVGPPASVQAALELIKRLDVPAVPDAQFEVFKLKFASAQAAATTLQQFYGATAGPGQQQQNQQQTQLQGLFPRVNVIPDFRTNALIVRASPRDLAEIASLLNRIDVDSSPSELTLRVFQLRNSLAEELAAVLQAAITGVGAAGQGQQIGPQLPGQQGLGQQGQQQQAQRSAVLRLMTLDARERKILRSGILTEVQVTADARANSVLVRAPADSMPLIEALIEQLDNIPGATSQIKVFTILNGDAESLVSMLSALFGQATNAGQFGGGQFGTQGASIQSDGSIVPLRFAVDNRTNSILATGSSSDLTIVEAILLRLDESDVRERETQVYRLKNAPSLDVANSINQLLQAERAVQQQGVRSAFQQIQEEVVVVGEPVTNSLIVTATPRYFDEIRRIIDELDRRPPMVMIQVLIGEVQLNNTDEFGVELGLQDSILFDRSLLGDLITTTNSTQTPQGNTVVTATNQIIQGASMAPGYLFNNQPIGNSGSDFSRNTSNKVGGQALSSFSVGRVNSQLGYGGLVLSASNESISILIRALQECRRLDVLSRPQVMTLDNQPAFIQVGQRVQLITATTFDQATGIQTNQLGAQQNVGLILGVTPRISPDGLVVMEIDVEKSEVGPESEGIPVSVLPTGDVIRSPRINTTLAQSTVSAISGQTIVLGGLITKTKAQTHRRVPLLASIPVLGHLFRYDANVQQRTELLIILTPRVVRDEADMELIKQVESSRMHWVLSDVRDLHGDAGIRGRGDAWEEPEIPIIYPHVNPSGRPEEVPAGKLTPSELDAVPDGSPLPPPRPQPPGPLRPLPRVSPTGHAAQQPQLPTRMMPAATSPAQSPPAQLLPVQVQPATWHGPAQSGLPQWNQPPPNNAPPAVQPAVGLGPPPSTHGARPFPSAAPSGSDRPWQRRETQSVEATSAWRTTTASPSQQR